MTLLHQHGRGHLWRGRPFTGKPFLPRTSCSPPSAARQQGGNPHTAEQCLHTAAASTTTARSSCRVSEAHQQQPRDVHSENSSAPPAAGWSGAGKTALHAGLSAVVSLQLLCCPPSEAVLNSPNAQIARSVDAALRRSIPAFNPQVGSMQRTLEEVAFLLRIPQRKPWGNMASDVAASLAALEDRQQLLAGVPSDKLPAAEGLLDTIATKLKQLELAVRTQQPDFAGLRTAEILQTIGKLELLQAPGLTFQIPKDYASLPRLVGRATVELTVEKRDGSLAFVNNEQGGLSKQGTVELTLDGYSAPVSAGNFAVNVLEGLYDNRPVQASYASVITPGGPNQAKPPIPLEILPAGEFDPLYRLPLDVQGGELPVLPLSLPGAVAMTHLPDRDSFVSGDEWFIYKFDKQQAGLAGLSFDEGTFGVFGYVTKGMEVVKQLESGDVIVKARLVSGQDRLLQAPAVGAPAPAGAVAGAAQ